MSDIVAVRRSALPAAPALGGGARVTFAPLAARFILRGGDGVRARAGAKFGIVPPTRPCSTAQAGGRGAIWLGPDEWLLIADSEDPRDIADALACALSSEPHSLVDVSHRQVGLSLTGGGSRRLLSAGCPLDLRSKAFPPGRAMRTVFAKAEIVVWRQAEERFRIEVWRSFADYVLALLSEAARGASDQ